MAIEPTNPLKSFISTRVLKRGSVPYRAISLLFGKNWPKYKKKTNGNQIYLTFDDGPNPGVTDQIAEILESAGHRATFFVVGENVERFPKLTKHLEAQGHGLGSHSFSHPHPSEISWWSRFKNYRLGHKVLNNTLDSKTNLFRTPHGTFDWCSLLASVSMRSTFYLWNTNSLDWQENSTPEEMVINLGDIEPGSIVLFHDAILDNPKAEDRTATIQAVKNLVEVLETQGLKSASLV